MTHDEETGAQDRADATVADHDLKVAYHWVVTDRTDAYRTELKQCLS